MADLADGAAVPVPDSRRSASSRSSPSRSCQAGRSQRISSRSPPLRRQGAYDREGLLVDEGSYDRGAALGRVAERDLAAAAGDVFVVRP
ncbi:hypothetical protein [Streptomyces sp. NPDC001492]